MRTISTYRKSGRLFILRENDFECLASTGVNAPVAMVPNAVRFNFFETETLPIKTLA